MEKERVNPLQRLLHLISLDKNEIVSIYFYAILSGLVQLSVPIGVQAIIGFVLGASMVTSIYVLTFLVVLGVFVVGVVQMNQMKIIEKIQQNIFTRNAFEFAEKIPRFDLIKADNYYLPEKINRFFDTLNVQKGLSKLLLDVPTATIQILFSLLLLSFYHPVFIVFGVLLVSILSIILRFTSRRGLITSLQESAYKYEVVAWFEEMARVLKSFKYSHGSHLNLQKTDKNVVGYLTARTEHFRVLLFQYRTLVFFKVVITAAMLTIGTYLLLTQQLNIGEFIAAEIVILTVINAVEKLISSLDSVYDVITGLEKLANVTETSLEKDGNHPLSTNGIGLSIDMVDFSFGYASDTKVLKNIDFSIPPNSTVCILGKEGSGKTTLLKALSGYFGNFSGALLFNKIPIQNYQLETLRNKTGVYLDRFDIFTGTVWENISMGRTEITADKIRLIAEKIGIQLFLNTIHEGFDAQIDPSGRKLPSTVAKKILLLRAFANNPSLILLREPWAGMESSIRKTMMGYLLSKTTNATVVVATNDEEFAKLCDYQIQLNNGVAKIMKN